MIANEMVKAQVIGAWMQALVYVAAHAASIIQRTRVLTHLGILVALGQVFATAAAQEPVNVPIEQGKSDKTSQTASVETNGYFVTGVVTDVKTRLPIANASIQLIVPAEPDATKRVLKGSTNADGRYRIAVPLGTVLLWYPSIKPGYWIVEPSQNMVKLTTSPDQPIANHDIRVKSAPVWNIRYNREVSAERNVIALMEIPDDNMRRKVLAREAWSTQSPLHQWSSIINADGYGAFTQIGDSGKLVVSVADAQAEVIVDANFDNTNVKSATYDPATKYTLMRDAEGRTARLVGATVETNAGVPTISFVPQEVELWKLKIVGTVLGPDTKPLSDVEVRAAVQDKVGGGVLEDRATITRSDGSFELQIDLPGFMQQSTQTGVMVSANFRKAGLVITDSKQVKLNANDTAIDVGTTILQPGNNIQVKAVDGNGKVLSGASITATTRISQKIYQARTGADGEATLTDLPADVVRIVAGYGQLSATAKVVVDDSTTRISTELKLLPISPAVEVKAPAIQTPVAIGKPAPEWTVQAWTDGKSRSLSELRGKVIVLEFWGIWCGPCVTSIPAMQKLADEYEQRGVAFVGIHSADGTIEEISKLKQLKNWAAPSAIDQGTSITDSKTAGAYGVTGFPTVVVIDVEGMIQYRTDILPTDMAAFTEDQRKLAEANGVEWPLPDNPTPAQAIEISNKMNYANIARQLDRLLKKVDSPYK